MQMKEDVYKRLQKHLDSQPVGYPVTKSGVEIRLLKRFFKPDEAELATRLSYKPRTIKKIYEDSKDLGMSEGSMERKLDCMMKNGVIGHMEREGRRYFFNVPLVVGMYEGQLYKLSKEFLSEFNEYVSSRAFGLEFLSTELPQMRTIPVEKSIQPQHKVATYDHLTDIISNTNGPFVINECICRKSAVMKGDPCKQTNRLETCLALGYMAENCIRAGWGREISRDEALEITMQNQADSLVLQPNNAQEIEFICACCGCCCGMLRVHKMLPRPVDFWSTNYYASVDRESCTGCGVCVERCQVKAVKMDEEACVSSVDLNRCIGCGNCVASCVQGAMSLVRKGEDSVPPKTTEELYDIIMANKKGTIGKIKLANQLILKR
jgi:electron transport complex protein RnfB